MTAMSFRQEYNRRHWEEYLPLLEKVCSAVCTQDRTVSILYAPTLDVFEQTYPEISRFIDIYPDKLLLNDLHVLGLTAFPSDLLFPSQIEGCDVYRNVTLLIVGSIYLTSPLFADTNIQFRYNDSMEYSKLGSYLATELIKYYKTVKETRRFVRDNYSFNKITFSTRETTQVQVYFTNNPQTEISGDPREEHKKEADANEIAKKFKEAIANAIDVCRSRSLVKMNACVST